MTESSNNSAVTQHRWNRIRMIENPALRYGLLILGVAYIFWSVGVLDINWHRISTGIPRARHSST